MNFRQKLVYTLFGALLALVGMLFGSTIAPPVTAQKGTDIVCTSLAVVDETGEPRILLTANQEGGTLAIMDKTENFIASLTTEKKKPALYLVDQKRNGKVDLVVNEYGGNILLSGGPGKGGVLMSMYEGMGIITVADKSGEVKGHLPDSLNVR